MVEPAPSAREPRRVLVVDGDRRVRTALSQLLTATDPDWIVTSTATCREAAVEASASTPDVALVDVAPPGDAAPLRFIRRLREQGVAVVALSAHDGQRREALAHGAAAFLPKGSAADNVVAVVRDVTGPLPGPAPEPADSAP